MNNNLFYRSLELNRSMLDKNERKLTLPVSSEQPVSRWFGKEVLLHDKDNIDMSRLNTALFNHNPDKIIGRIENARIEKKRIYVDIVFDDDDDGNKAMAKVESGSLRGASIGYMVNNFRELQKDEEWNNFKGPAMIATRWSIYEATLTPIPVDSTVGVGRDLTRSLDGIEIENKKKEEGKMEFTMDEVRAEIAKSSKDILDKIGEQVRSIIHEEKAPKMRIALERGNELADQASAISLEVENSVRSMIMSGKSEQEVTNFIMSELGKKRDAKDANEGAKKNEPSKNDSASLDSIDSDMFARSIANPVLAPRYAD